MGDQFPTQTGSKAPLGPGVARPSPRWGRGNAGFHFWRAALAGFALGFALVSGCGTDAQAVDECRDIEQARCEAGAACGLVDDVGACKRFYRDHCLHGMVVESPGQATVDACVAAIRAAGTCAQGDAEIPLADCPNDAPAPVAGLANACDVVLYPERTRECSFLPEGDGPASGAGGESGTSSGGGGENGSGSDPAAGGENGSGSASGGGAGAGGG